MAMYGTGSEPWKDGNYDVGRRSGRSQGIVEGFLAGRAYGFLYQEASTTLNFLDVYLNQPNGPIDLEMAKLKLNSARTDIAYLSKTYEAFGVNDSPELDSLKQRTEQIKQKVSLLEKKAKS
jgi:hypothetical protein